MITIEKSAREKILSMMEEEKRTHSGLRIKITGRGGSGYHHSLAFVDPGQEKPDDTIVEIEGIRVFLDTRTVPHIEGATIEFVDDIYGGGFKVENPNKPSWSDPLAQAIQDAIDNKVNPALAMHGGYVELVDVRDQYVYLNMGGGCQGCGAANTTVKQGIETMLLEEFPDLAGVVDATDHSKGQNPYYPSAVYRPDLT